MPFLVGHSLLDAELAADGDPYPVVILSPGFTATRGDYTAKMELLASHGFVGVCIDHSHAAATVFPDGTMLRGNASTTQLNAYFSEDVRDVQVVLDELPRMTQEDPVLKGSLDLEHIATMGHSFGGGVAGEAARNDLRVKATLHLDAYYQSATGLLQFGLSKPLLYTFSTEGGGLQTVFNQSTQDAVSFHVKGLRHGDFGDVWYWVDRPDETTRHAVLALNNCMLSFFNKYLKGEDDHLLDNPSAVYSEIDSFRKK